MRGAAELIPLFVALAALLSPATASGFGSLKEEGAFRLSGYFKTYAIGVSDSPFTGNAGVQSLNAVRLNGTWLPDGDLRGEIHYELQPVFQSVSSNGVTSALPLSRGKAYRISDLNAELYANSDGGIVLFQNLDRFSLRWSAGAGDLTVGRQAVTFGSARAINPTDVLLPFAVQQLNVEYRIGVDAVRYRLALGSRDELDLGVVLGNEGRSADSAAFVRLGTSLFETDWVLQGMTLGGAWLVGGGFQRGLWDLGWSLDWAQVFGEPTRPYFRVSTSLDYMFESGLVLFGEYHFNGAGTSDPSRYVETFSSFAFQRGGVFLAGRHYVIPGASYPVTPLIGARLQALLNVQDGSVFVAPGLEYSISENTYVDAGAFITAGPGSPAPGLLGSEYGSFPSMMYLDLRYYF